MMITYSIDVKSLVAGLFTIRKRRGALRKAEPFFYNPHNLYIYVNYKKKIVSVGNDER